MIHDENIISEQLSLNESAVGMPLACWLQPGEQGCTGRQGVFNYCIHESK